MIGIAHAAFAHREQLARLQLAVQIDGGTAGAGRIEPDQDVVIQLGGEVAGVFNFYKLIITLTAVHVDFYQLKTRRHGAGAELESTDVGRAVEGALVAPGIEIVGGGAGAGVDRLAVATQLGYRYGEAAIAIDTADGRADHVGGRADQAAAQVTHPVIATDEIIHIQRERAAVGGVVQIGTGLYGALYTLAGAVFAHDAVDDRGRAFVGQSGRGVLRVCDAAAATAGTVFAGVAAVDAAAARARTSQRVVVYGAIGEGQRAGVVDAAAIAAVATRTAVGRIAAGIRLAAGRASRIAGAVAGNRGSIDAHRSTTADVDGTAVAAVAGIAAFGARNTRSGHRAVASTLGEVAGEGRLVDGDVGTATDT